MRTATCGWTGSRTTAPRRKRKAHFEYPPGASVPIVTLDDPGAALPVGIAVSRRGTVYIANTTNNTGVQTAIMIYDPGATEPSRMLLPPTQDDELGWIALDREGNLYADYFNPVYVSSGVLEWMNARGPAVDLGIGVPDESLATTRSGALLACGGGCFEIDRGTVVRSFATKKKQRGGKAALRADEKEVFVTSGLFSCGTWKYPRAGAPLGFFNINADVTGMAASPAPPPGGPYTPATPLPN